MVAAQPARPVVFFEGETWSYSRLWTRAQSVAASLSGITRYASGQRVAVIGSNTPEYLAAVIDVAVTRDAESPDTRSELAQVPPLQALETWSVAERRWLATSTRAQGGRSMPVRIHPPSERPPPRGFSEATSGNGVIAISGQLPDEEVLERGAPFHEQFTSALARFLEVAGAGGAGAEDILMMRIYVTSVDTYKAELKQFGSEYRAAYNGQYPATTLIGVSALIDERAMVEIEGLAAMP